MWGWGLGHRTVVAENHSMYKPGSPEYKDPRPNPTEVVVVVPSPPKKIFAECLNPKHKCVEASGLKRASASCGEAIQGPK